MVVPPALQAPPQPSRPRPEPSGPRPLHLLLRTRWVLAGWLPTGLEPLPNHPTPTPTAPWGTSQARVGHVGLGQLGAGRSGRAGALATSQLPAQHPEQGLGTRKVTARQAGPGGDLVTTKAPQ